MHAYWRSTAFEQIGRLSPGWLLCFDSMVQADLCIGNLVHISVPLLPMQHAVPRCVCRCGSCAIGRGGLEALQVQYLHAS